MSRATTPTTSSADSTERETQHRLLDAAGEVFAAKGFRAATVREICTQAGANVAAVNYHFGDKEGLYAEVLRYSHACSMERHPPEMSTTGASSPEERLRAFIVSFLHRMFDKGRPAWHAKLFMREMIEPTGALAKLVKQTLRPRRDQLEQIIRDLAGDRVGDDEQLMRHCVVSIVGQCTSYFHARPVLVHLYPQLGYDDAGIDERAEYIYRFTLAALRGIGPSAKGKAEKAETVKKAMARAKSG